MAQAGMKMVSKIPVWGKAFTDFSKPHAQRFWALAKVELRPPTPAEVGEAVSEIQTGVKNLTNMKWMNYTVRQGWQNTLVFTEVAMWFFIGEVIGRRSLIGYKV